MSGRPADDPTRRTAAQHIAAALDRAPTEVRNPWVASLAAGLAYAAVGSLTFALSGGPSWAMPIWPAVGIAVAAMLLLGPRAYLGIFVGSAANMMLWDGVSAWASAGVVAFAATAGPAFGVLLARRFVREPMRLLETADVVKFLLLIGPVGCTVSALLAPSALSLRGTIPVAELPAEILTWWAGDTIGALTVTPILLSLVGVPTICWRPRQARVAFPLAVVLTATIVGIVRERGRLEERSGGELRAAGMSVEMELRSELERATEAIHGLAAYFAGSEDVAPTEFEPFAQRLLGRLESVDGLLWVAPTPDGRATVVVYAQPRRRFGFVGRDLSVHASLAPLFEPSASSSGVMSDPVLLPEFRRPHLVYSVAVPSPSGNRPRGWAVGLIGLEELEDAAAVATPFATCVASVREGPGACSHDAGSRRIHAQIAGLPWFVTVTDVEGALDMAERQGLRRALVLLVLLALTASSVLLALTGRNIALQLEMAGREKAEAALEKLTQALRDANRELEQFAYMASHDLRAPLRAINGLSEWIAEESGDRLVGDSAKHLAMLRSRVARLDAMISGLLEFSRAGRLMHPVERINVGDLVAEVAEVHEDGRFTVVARGLPAIVGHRAPLQQVLANLVSNAFKHHDRPTGQVTISVRVVGDMVEFRVGDDGPGIEPRFREAVFEPFRTLRSRDEVEGSGMGLATVRRLVEAEGGTIRVEAGEPRGAVFVFTWPRAARDRAETAGTDVRSGPRHATVASEDHG